jgi:peptidylprolyl isomerase
MLGLHLQRLLQTLWHPLSRLVVWAVVIGAIALGVGLQPAQAGLAQGNAITDPSAILRYALPIDNPEVRRLQKNLEELSEGLRTKRWGAVVSNLKSARRAVKYGNEKILASIPEAQKAEAQDLLDTIETEIETLFTAAEKKDAETLWMLRRQVLDRVGEVEAKMVSEFPFTVPEDYADLPQLKGRATIELQTNKGTMKIVADGYNAPVTAGNIVDLVQRGFYDGLPFFQTQDFILQTGDPIGPAAGFEDPETGEYRAIPLEIMVRGDREPIYEITLEDAGLYLADLALPFNAYGAVGLGHPNGDVNGGSSQFFFFLFDTELTPPGFNLIDGRYSVWGYVVEGQDVLDTLGAGDKIIQATVVEGAENLVQPT